MKYVRLKAELDGNLSFHSASPSGLRTASDRLCGSGAVPLL